MPLRVKVYILYRQSTTKWIECVVIASKRIHSSIFFSIIDSSYFFCLFRLRLRLSIKIKTDIANWHHCLLSISCFVTIGWSIHCYLFLASIHPFRAFRNCVSHRKPASQRAYSDVDEIHSFVRLCDHSSPIIFRFSSLRQWFQLYFWHAKHSTVCRVGRLCERQSIDKTKP